MRIGPAAAAQNVQWRAAGCPGQAQIVNMIIIGVHEFANLRAVFCNVAA